MRRGVEKEGRRGWRKRYLGRKPPRELLVLLELTLRLLVLPSFLEGCERCYGFCLADDGRLVVCCTILQRVGVLDGVARLRLLLPRRTKSWWRHGRLVRIGPGGGHPGWQEAKAVRGRGRAHAS